MDIIFDHPPQKPRGAPTRVTPRGFHYLDDQSRSNYPHQSRLARAKTNPEFQSNQGGVVPWSTNDQFTDLVKCLNHAGQLLHHGEIWSEIPAFVHSQVDDILTHVTPPMSTTLYQDQLNSAKTTFKQQITNLTLEHIQTQLSSNTLKLQQLNPKDKEVAAKIALKQLQTKLSRANPTKLHTWVQNALSIVGTLYQSGPDQMTQLNDGEPTRYLETTTGLWDMDPVPHHTTPTELNQTEADMDHHDENFSIVTNQNRKRNRTISPSIVPIRNFYDPLDQFKENLERATPSKRRHIRRSISVELSQSFNLDSQLTTWDPPSNLKEISPNHPSDKSPSPSPLPLGVPMEELVPSIKHLEPTPITTIPLLAITPAEPGDDDLESSSHSPSILITPFPQSTSIASGLNLTHLTTEIDPKLIKQKNLTSKLDSAIYTTLQNPTIAISSDEETDETQVVAEPLDITPLNTSGSPTSKLNITQPGSPVPRLNTPTCSRVQPQSDHQSTNQIPMTLGTYNGRRYSLPFEKNTDLRPENPKKCSNITVHTSTFF